MKKGEGCVWTCPKCSETAQSKPNFCPNCGISSDEVESLQNKTEMKHLNNLIINTKTLNSKIKMAGIVAIVNSTTVHAEQSFKIKLETLNFLRAI